MSEENKYSVNLSVYNDKELGDVVKDLMARAKKWLKNGYRNEELLAFINRLVEHLSDFSTRDKLQALVEESYKVKNRHKFLY